MTFTKFQIAFLMFLQIGWCFSARAEEPTVIMIMVDGARPDVVEQMALSGQLPEIRRHFYDDGTVYQNSFTSMALTVPSWSTIFTGLDIDKTGIKGNDVFNRQTKNIDNFLDVRQDILVPKNFAHRRAYRVIRETQHKMLPDFFYSRQDGDADGLPPEDFGVTSPVYFTFFPVGNRFPQYMLGGFVPQMFYLDLVKQSGIENSLIRYLFETHNGMEAIDRESLKETLSVMRDPRGPKKKVIGLYFGAVDHLSHLDAVMGRKSLSQVDYAVGMIFKAMRETRYHDSVVIMVSDHGSIGGNEDFPEDLDNPLRGMSFGLTPTSLSHFFSGWFNKAGYADYNFNVQAAFAAEGKFSLRNLSEVQLQPFQCTKVAHVEYYKYNRTCPKLSGTGNDKVTAGVTTSETVSLPYASRVSGDWSKINNWYTLTHYHLESPSDKAPLVKNILKDLEHFEVENLVVDDPAVAQKIGKKPLDWLAVTIAKEDFNRSPAVQKMGPSMMSDTDVVVIHRSDVSEGLILQRANGAGQRLYKYMPVKNFLQNSNGDVTFQLNDHFDPLDYRGNSLVKADATGAFIDDERWFQGFHGDRQWAGRYSRTSFPNVVFALPRYMQSRGGASEKFPNLRADIYLNPHYGHMFTVDNDTDEVNHGMWQRESVRNLFMITGPVIKRGQRVEIPAFATDVVPTVFESLRRLGLKNGSGENPLEPGVGFDGRSHDEMFLQ